MRRAQPLIDAPIPGQSLTSEPGARPWENPAKYSTVEETLEFYIDNLSQPQKMAEMLDKIEEGAPLTLIADTLQTIGVSKGLHSLDVGILITPVLIEFMKAAAEQAEVEYVVGSEAEDMANSDEDEAMARMVAREVLTEKKPVDDMMMETEDTPVPEDMPKGLMSRRGEQ
jgi:hypothetical protein